MTNIRKILRYFTKKLTKVVLVSCLVIITFLGNLPFGLIEIYQAWEQERNIVDVLWLAQHDSLVVDSFFSSALAAQVTIESDTTDTTDEFGPSPTVVFVNDQVGYLVFVDNGNDLAYRKTTNGGSNWSSPVVIDNTIAGWTAVSVWYDQWTPGDSSGNRIHIAATDDSGGDAYYTYLDTDTDTLKTGPVLVINQTSFTESVNSAPSIAKGGDGSLFISANFSSVAGGYVYKSSDGSGDTWSNITPADWSSASTDQVQLLPLLTDNDIIAIRADTTNNDIDYRIYDEVSDVWGGSWSASITSLVDNATYDQWFSASLRKSTGDIYLTLNNNTNNSANDIEFWSFDDSSRAGGFVQGSNVFTNSNQVLSPISMVDEETGDLYVAYLKGQTNFVFQGGGVNSITYLYYKKSSDGGLTWSSERGVINDDLGDDYKYIRGNLLSSDRLYVAIYDDDDNDIFGTTVMANNVLVEANIDTLIIDATDEFGPSPSGVFIDEDIGYQFFVRTNVAFDTTDEFGASPSVVFTDENNGYIFFIDSPSQDLVYRRTTNGGLNWSGSRVIDTDRTGWANVSVWYDQWTPGDTTGTKIHVAAVDDASDDIFYTYLDTNGDLLKGSMVTAVSGTAAFVEAADGPPSITKGSGGALFIAGNFTNTVGGKVSKSVDGAGNVWSNITPSGWSSVAIDQVQLLPLLTDNDIIAIRADTVGNEMESRVYDEVGDSWDAGWTSIGSMIESTAYDQWFSATIDKSTGTVYLVFNNTNNNSANDIEFWSYGDGSRVWVKSATNVFDNTNVLAPVPFYETDTGNIYVAYARGTVGSSVQVFYKSTSDGGATWSAESSALNSVNDDFKVIKGSMMGSDNLYIAWYNDDTNQIKGDNILSPQSYDLPITGQSVVYRKTLNGGGAWGPPYVVASMDGAISVAVWYDQWTPGDTTGTKIHVAFSDDRTDDYYYTYLDTNGDVVGYPKAVLLGSTITEAAVGVPGITKGSSGNIFLSGNFNTPVGGMVAKSTDGGTSWTTITPTAWSTVTPDQVQLLPLLTGSDIIAIKAQTADNTIRYRIYDETGDAWGASWDSIASLVDNTTYDQWFSASLRKSTGDIYLAFANNTNNVANDIEFWTFDDSSRVGGFTQKSNIYNNSNTVMMPLVMSNELSDELYVAYLRGSLNNSMNVHFKKSMDEGATWSGESVSLSPGIVDDVKSLRGSLLGSSRLYAFWYNDDLNDIYGNTVADTWQIRQSAYRFFANTDSTDVGSPLASQNTLATLSASGEAFRLRLLLHSSGDMPTRGNNLKLQFAEKSGTCDIGFSGESYSDVTGVSTISFNNNPTPADGATLTPNVNDPINDGNTNSNQSYEESNPFTTLIGSVGSGQEGMWDFSLYDNGASVNTSYCFRVVKSDGSLLDNYAFIPEVVTASSGVLSVDIVDSLGASVSSPSIALGDITFSFSDQVSSGVFGTSDEKIRITNTTGSSQWTLSLASDFTTSFWDGTPADYDFNDPSPNASDGADLDSLGGQMSVDASLNGVITPQVGCSSDDLLLGSTGSFSEGVSDSITILSAGATADTGCYWDLTGVDILQSIPPEQPASNDYNINMVLTITAI